MDEVTFSFVKPNAYDKRQEIEEIITKSGLVIALRKDPARFSRKMAENFYREHRSKPFFKDIVDAYSEKDIAAYLIGGNDALARLSRLVGHTNPKIADPGTIRNLYGDHNDMLHNAIHRSSMREVVRREGETIFTPEEIDTMAEPYKGLFKSYPIVHP